MKNTKKISRIIKAYALILALIVSSLAITGKNTKIVYGATEIVTSNLVPSYTERNYVNTMINHYLKDSNVARNYNSGKAVIMMFEGAGNTSYNNATTGKRTGALCLVIKKDSSGNPKIVYSNKDCSTLPDHPKAYGSFGNFTGDGKSLAPATVKDGIYKAVVVNHGSYSGLNVRTFVNSSTSVPVVCLKQGGGYYQRNASGINVHTRGTTTVSSDVKKPSSAGCLLISSTTLTKGSKFTEYRNFIDNVYPSSVKRVDQYYNGKISYRNTTGWGTEAGTIVIDRYLYRDTMYKIYGNIAAVDLITKNSADAFSKASTLNVILYIGKESMYKGSTNSVSGIIDSQYKVSKFTVEIYNEYGAKEQSATIDMNSTFVSISTTEINSQLKFEKLLAGKYQLKLTANDSKYGNAPVSVIKTFTVK